MGSGGHNALRAEPPRPGAARPRSVAATAGARMEMRGVRGTPHPRFAGRHVGHHFPEFPRSGDVGERPLHRDADALPARPWRRWRWVMLPGAGVGWHNALTPRDPGRLSGTCHRVVRRRDRPRSGGDARRAGGGAASMICAGRAADGVDARAAAILLSEPEDFFRN